MEQLFYTFITGGFIITGSIIGAFLGGIFAYYTTIKTIKIQFFNKASASFNATFTKELILLDDRYITEKTPMKDAYTILHDAFLRHSIAYNRFKTHIGKEVTPSYEKAWNDLYCPYKDHKEGSLDFVFLEYWHSRDPEQIKTLRKEALEKLNILINFSKQR